MNLTWKTLGNESGSTLVENCSQGSSRGAPTVHGGLAQDKRGPTETGHYDEAGEFHALSGYARNFHYNRRLRTLLPPGYSAIIFGGRGFSRLFWREIAPVDLTCWEG